MSIGEWIRLLDKLENRPSHGFVLLSEREYDARDEWSDGEWLVPNFGRHRRTGQWLAAHVSTRVTGLDERIS